MQKLWRRARTHPSAVLLVAQLLAVVLYPFLGDSAGGRAGLGVASLLFLGLAIWTVRSTPALNVVAVALGMPVMVLTVVESLVTDNDVVRVVSALLHAAFYFYVTYAMLRYLFHDLVVTADELFAVGATFTVLAWAFAYVFVVVEILWPGSFAPWPDGTPFFDALFVSFTTLTSVGLSDVLPVTGQGRAVLMIEELAGVMYLAMVVSRLVGLTLNRGSR